MNVDIRDDVIEKDEGREINIGREKINSLPMLTFRNH